MLRFSLEDFRGNLEDRQIVRLTPGYRKLRQLFIVNYHNHMVNVQVVNRSQDTIFVRIADKEFEAMRQSLLMGGGGN